MHYEILKNNSILKNMTTPPKKTLWRYMDLGKGSIKEHSSITNTRCDRQC